MKVSSFQLVAGVLLFLSAGVDCFLVTVKGELSPRAFS